MFRQALLNAYGCSCAISGCTIEVLLEAAHIVPYRGAQTNIVANGLLLRADLHKLFDLHLLCIDPDTRIIQLSGELKDSEYSRFDNVRLRAPIEPHMAPLTAALKHHYERCSWLKADSNGMPLDDSQEG
jgi:predicted restriction endonuclease